MSISQSIFITVDAVIFLKEDKRKSLLLIKRKNKPYKEQWALPGGFVEDEERVAYACQRELNEETGLDLNLDEFTFVNYFDAPKRDPRSRTITFVFKAEINQRKEIKGNDDAAEARWFDVDNLPKLAFDHSEIIQKALSSNTEN